MSEALQILVIEDNPADADLIRELLPATGPTSFQIESVARLADAVIRLKDEGHDLVLLDLGLPDSQGLQTLRRLRQAAPGVAVIVLTGTDDNELGLAALHEGAQDYLAKGQINRNLMVRSIRYALEREKILDDLRQARAAAETALATVKTLTGLLPICAACKQIRDDQGYWNKVETYIAKHTDVQFTHSLCPDCVQKYFPDQSEP
jgi:DNA-binding response OmpR family regulator